MGGQTHVLKATMQPPHGDRSRGEARHHKTQTQPTLPGGNIHAANMAGKEPCFWATAPFLESEWCFNSSALLLWSIELWCLKKSRHGGDLRSAYVKMFALALCLKCWKISLSLDERLQLILDFVFLRKLLPQSLESYIKALQINSHCIKTVYAKNK